MKRFLPHVVAFLVVAIWGTTFVFTKLLLLGGLTAAQIFILRFIIAYVLLLGYCLARGIRWLADSWRDELLMVALGVTGGSLYFLTENSAMNYTTTTNTSIIVSLCPLFASAFIGFFYKSERLSRLQTLGTLMAAAGVIVVVMNGHFVLHLSPLGDTLAFAACLCWAFYSLLMIPANKRYDTVFVTLLGVELGTEAVRRRRRHELCLPKPRHNYCLRLVPPCRGDHPVVHSRHCAHPPRHVPCGYKA